jgi:hypothetical protein
MNDQEPNSVKLDIAVPFEMGACAKCEAPGIGQCGECGEEIEPPSPDSYASARQRALQAAADRAKRLTAEIETVEPGGVPLAPNQFMAAVEELEIGAMLDDLDTVGRTFDGMDFGDKKTVGSEVRTAVDRHLDKVEQVLEALRSLANFCPAPPADDFLKRIKDSCLRSAELAVSLLELFRASTYREGEQASQRVQASWERFLDMSGLIDAKERVDGASDGSLNERVELALGRPGTFLSEDGSIDPGRVLLSYFGEASPLESLSTALHRYFAALLDGSTFSPTAAPGLVGPLVLLAGTDRPVSGHEVASLMAEGLRSAHKRNPEAVESLAQRSSSEGPTIYAALSRVGRAFDNLKEDSADTDAADRIMASYRQIAESIFRTVGWLAIDLEALASGTPASKGTQPPMLGELRDRLTSGGPLGQALAKGVDVGLRNAEAHVQYRWIPEGEVIRDWRTEEEWDVDRLLDAFHRLTAVVAGADAAFACFVASNELKAAPEYLFPGEAPEVFPVLATLTFSSWGFEVQDVSRDGGTIAVVPPAESDPSQVLPGLAGYAAFCRGPSKFRIEGPDGSALAEVQASTLSLFAEAQPATKGLATIAIVFESAVRIGMDPERAGYEFVALALKSIAVESKSEFETTEFAPRAFQHLSVRINYLRDLTMNADLGFPIPKLAQLRSDLSRTRAPIKRARQGQQSALKMLLNGLTELENKGDEVEAVWPPVV